MTTSLSRKFKQGRAAEARAAGTDRLLNSERVMESQVPVLSRLSLPLEDLGGRKGETPQNPGRKAPGLEGGV